MNGFIRWSFFMIGLMLFSLGITMAINVQHLGIQPWDVLSVALFDYLGLSIGTWNIIIGIVLIVISYVLDKSYVRFGTFINVIAVGVLVDFYMWLDFLPKATHSWIDIVIILMAIIIMGISGGIYNAASVGSGPRDGFMLSIAEKIGVSIGKVRIITETIVLVIGLILGGPVFIFTFIFTFIQSPLFQLSYVHFKNKIDKLTDYASVKYTTNKNTNLL